MKTEDKDALGKDWDKAHLRFSVLAQGLGHTLADSGSHYYPAYARAILDQVQEDLLPALTAWEIAAASYNSRRRMRYVAGARKPKARKPAVQ